jgi:hypothetical protein
VFHVRSVDDARPDARRWLPHAFAARNDAAAARYDLHSKPKDRAMRVMRLRRKLVALLMLVWLCVALSACYAGDETMGLDVVGYNHTDHSIGSFSVNGRGGSFLMSHKGGGGFVCCVSIPRIYKPGMTVTVRWTDEAGDNPQERAVVVPPYTPADGGMFAVHFLRSGEIKVFVTMLGLGHPDYPLKGEEAKK